jgi:hypothetical protein
MHMSVVAKKKKGIWTWDEKEMICQSCTGHLHANKEISIAFGQCA